MDQGIAAIPRPLAVSRRRLILAASLLATFMPAVESTIVATAMPTIVGDLGGFRLFSWVFATPLLTMAVTIPLYGRLADLYGRKRIFFIGTGIFLVGTTLCGFARSIEMLILLRALQGLGSGAIQPISMTILGDVYTPAQRAKVQGLQSSVFGVAAIVGPALGAFLVEHAHWSVVFWVNLPIGVLSIAMFAIFFDERVERREHRIDWLGGALLVVGIGALMLALVQAVRFSAGQIGALVAFGVAALALLVVHEYRTPEPMMPLGLWRRRVLALSNLAGFATSASYMVVAALLPVYVQGVMGGSPGLAGFTVGAASVSWMFASLAAARVMIRTTYRLTALIGAACLFAGSVILTRLDPAASVLWAIGGSFVFGIAMGFCNTTFVVAIQANVVQNQRGVATGSQMFMRMIGMSSGAALYGAIVNFGVHRRLPGADDAVNKLLLPTLRQGLGGDGAARLAEAVAQSAHYAFLASVMLAAAALLLALAFPKGLSPTRPAPR